jgi:hypothetical protein
MDNSREIRKKATRIRRVASVRTYGDRTIDRELMQLADKLEYEAGEMERKSATREKQGPPDA